MKKLTALFLCMLLATTMSTVIFAADGNNFSATATETTLYRGDTVTLNVEINSTEKATSYGLALEYDESIFELVEGKCKVADSLVSSFVDGFAFMFQEAVAYSGSVGTVTLKVKDDATFGNAEVKGVASVKNGSDVVSANGCTVTFEIACKHNYGAWTETDNGHSQTCSICQNVNTGAHNWDNGTVVKDATCTEEGQKTFACVDCTATKNESIAVIAHSYGDWANADADTHKHVCSVCQKEESEAHSFGDKLIAGENTHWYYCECGMKKDEVEHSYDEKKWDSNEEKHWHTCACGTKSTETEHNWDAGKVTKEATEKEEGVKTYTCVDCKSEKTEKIAKKETPQSEKEFDDKKEETTTKQSGTATGNKKPQSSTPQTGDNMGTTLVVMMCVLLGCSALVVCVAKRKANN